MDKTTMVILCLEIGTFLGALCLCIYASTMVKHLPGEIEKTVEDKLSKRIALRDRLETEKKYWQQYRDDEKEKAKQMVAGIDLGCGYWKPPEKPKAKLWVAEVVLPKDGSKQPVYFFHCPDANSTKPGIHYGKHYLYSGRGFVTTDNPATAILLQQLLNDGSLTVKPFTNETNQ